MEDAVLRMSIVIGHHQVEGGQLLAGEIAPESFLNLRYEAGG